MSTVAMAVVLITCLLIDFNLKLWQRQDRVIEWDVHWYYGYLPALFIYDDIRLEKSDYKFENNYYLIWTVPTSEGKKIIKSTSGLAMMYAPFFFVANIFASLTNYPENGYSEPYKIFLLLSALFYLYIGLDFLRKILRHYNFNDRHIAITILLLGIGTNLLCYSSESAAMPHVYNFCLFSVFIYYTIRWYQSHSYKNTIILGLLLGLISLIRPSNCIIMIFFGLFGISNFSELKQRMTFLRREWFLINVIFFFALLVWIPQFIYWKITTGNYFVDSYVGERFFFNDPKFLEGFLGFRKGWLIYTPIMLFSIIGLFIMKDRLKKLRLPIVLFFLVNVYIIFSWWCWWYGGCFGQRSMIDSYALLAIPLASFVEYISARKKFIRGFGIIIALFFIWLNIFQTFQFEYHSIHWDGMTKELYFKNFGQLHQIKDYDKMVVSPDSEMAKRGKRSQRQWLQEKRESISTDYNGRNVSGQKIINLKAFNNKYVCADQDKGNMAFANRMDAGEWETFKLTQFENNVCVLQSFKQFFLSAELGRKNEISAVKTKAGDWEYFTIVNTSDSLVAFRASNNKYLSVDKKSWQLFANGDSLNEENKFKMILR